MTGIAAQPARGSSSNRWVAIAAVAFGLLTAVLIVRYLSQQTHERKVNSTASVPVVVAKQDIAASAMIAAEMVDLKLVTPDVAAKGALAQTGQAIGQRARYAVPAGAQIIPGMLVQPVSSDALSFVVPPGKRAVAVGTTDVINGGNHIRPGDYVDVLAIFEQSKLAGASKPAVDQNLNGVVTVLQNIQVLAVADQATNAPDSGPQDNSGKSGNTPDLKKNGTVTLAVDPYQSQLLFLAESEGKIRLALRPFGDQEQQQVTPVLEPLGVFR